MLTEAEVQRRYRQILKKADADPDAYDKADVAGLLKDRLGEARKHLEEALEAVRMSAYADRLSHHLSMGEKKRIAIATVLSMRPSLLVLDEPSAGLDPRARRTLIHLLHELPLTMLVSTHDMALVKELFPRIVVMDDGVVVADGLTGDILEDAELLEAHGLERA